MASRGTNLPAWYPLSHQDRYRRLEKIRRVWARRHYGKGEDRRGRVVHWEGACITDIPGFYLSLGEAINGRHGYFGGCLDALADCLRGNFGVLPPLTVRLTHFEDVRAALDGRAWCRFRAEAFRSLCQDGDSRDTAAVYTGDLQAFILRADHLREDLIDSGFLGDGSAAEVDRWVTLYQNALNGDPFDADGFGSYFDALLEVFASGGASLVPETQAANQ